MKKKWFSPARILLLGTAIAGAVSFSSCDKNEDKPENNMFTISGSGSSSQVFPPFSGSATGTISGTYNRQSNQLDYNVGWTGLTDTASSVGFYTGASGAAGEQAETLSVTTQGQTGSSAGTMLLTEAQEADLLAGKWYYSVGTLANIGGEVRGQITAAQ